MIELVAPQEETTTREVVEPLKKEESPPAPANLEAAPSPATEDGEADSKKHKKDDKKRIHESVSMWLGDAGSLAKEPAKKEGKITRVFTQRFHKDESGATQEVGEVKKKKKTVGMTIRGWKKDQNPPPLEPTGPVAPVSPMGTVKTAFSTKRTSKRASTTNLSPVKVDIYLYS